MIHVVRTAVDWFEYSCKGSLGEGVAVLLADLKQLAQTLEWPQPVPCCPVDLYVARHGAKPWAWVVKGDDLQLRMSDKRGIPGASALLSADGLAAYGHDRLYSLSTDLLERFGDFAPTCTSRLDLAVDFQGWVPTAADMENIVCRASYHGEHGHNGQTETYQFGSDALVVRIYNKTKELQKSNKLYLVGEWSDAKHYDPERDVWRFETQLRRQGLQSFGVKEPDAVLEALPELLGSMLQWCSLRIPAGENRSRWPVDPRWEQLAVESFAAAPLPRVPEEKRLASFAKTVQQVKGHVLSAAAARRVYEFDVAWGLLGRDVEAYLRSEGDFEELVRQRIAERTG